MSLLSKIQANYQSQRNEIYTLTEYLNLCKKDSGCYATASERLLKAIGEPNYIDTSKDLRLSRIFMNRTIRYFPSFEDFYGMEDVIENVVSYLKASAQGLEESKQILYLLGPVGSAKSSLAERLKELVEREPIYVLKWRDEISPVFESPLVLFPEKMYGKDIQKEYNIPLRYLNWIKSPWATKKLEESKGNLEDFTVVKMYPSRLTQVGVMKTEPGDENNQDISTLVGKVDLRKLEKLSQNDPDAYMYSGGLNRTSQGMLEFVEMFKAPIKMLHPLLTATQEHNYVGTENIGAMPHHGIVLAHSNETEWATFKNNKNNEAFIDRVYIVKVPYCLRVDEEIKIYQKILSHSDLFNAPCTPHVLDIMAKFSVLTRIKEHANSSQISKMRIYNGESLKESDPKAKSVYEYRTVAGINEGMEGSSTRFAYKTLSAVFNYDPKEVAADPVHLFLILEDRIKREQMSKETEEKYLSYLKDHLIPQYTEDLGKVIQKTYLESYSEYGQNIFDKYVAQADAWIEEQDFKHPDTGQVLNRASLEAELSKIEKPAGISNPKDFRNEVVKFCLRARAKNDGNNPSWTSYEKIREVIEKNMFSNSEELLPIISFESKRSSEQEKKHNDFVSRMTKEGYTERQVQRLVDWYVRARHSA